MKSVFITAFNREKIFFKTLAKLKCCKNYSQYNVVIIYQDVNETVLKKIKKIDSKIKIIKTEYKNNISGLQKCNLNSYLGFKKCFEEYKSDYVIYLEDDVLPSYDFLEYHDYIISHYQNDKKFFSANSFSKEYYYNNSKNFYYSKFIYGIGKGFSISRNKWKFLKKMYKRLFFEKREIFYDCYFEQEIKKRYFVIMPYRSRTFEQPSNGLNSKLHDKKNIFYKSWKKSFLNKKKFEIKNYIFSINMKYTWRDDCLKYTAFNFYKSYLKLLYGRIMHYINNTTKIEN
jgi:hypothetical protein